MSGVQAVVFDLGETLVDETRMWEIIARAAGVPVLTFEGVLGSVIERRLPHRAVFTEFGIEPIEGAAQGYHLERRDFYPDAIPVLHRLRELGFRLGIAGNQPPGVVEELAGLDLPLDLISSSASFGVAKPDPRFFERIAMHLGIPAAAIAYVGDRLDNDVLPAQAVGMRAIFLRRGPWGYIHAAWPEAARVPCRIDGLQELPDLLLGMRGHA
ncbi:MAG TPA: HAD family hydrolase [Thermomicrobiales bacterium]|nr:HAD family hydrolase [Thermomicrobiales bacterium]